MTDSRLGWLQAQGIISSHYDFGGVSDHHSDRSGRTLSRDEGSPRSHGAIPLDHGGGHINTQNTRSRAWGPLNTVSGNDSGNGYNFGPSDKAIGRRHLDRGPVTRKWATGTNIKNRKTVLDKPTWPSVSRVRRTSAQEYEDSHYGYAGTQRGKFTR